MREKIFQHLWDKVKTLIDRYSLVNIVQALRLNTNQIKDNLGIQTKVNFTEVKIDSSSLFNNQSLLSTSVKGQSYSHDLKKFEEAGSGLRICIIEYLVKS